MTTVKKKKRKQKPPPEPHWNEMVHIYFEFCRSKFNENPTFDGSSPRDMKAIIKALRERAEKSNVEWTLDVAQFRWKSFLEFAFKDQWLSKNWLLSNINRQKDKIFFNIRAAINRKPADPFE